MRPWEFVAMEPRMAGVGVLEFAGEREPGLTREVTYPLGPAAVIGRELVARQSLRQIRERRGPARPCRAGGVAHPSNAGEAATAHCAIGRAHV